MGMDLREELIFAEDTLLFADDQEVVANVEDELSYMVRKLIKEYEEWGLK